MLLTLHMYQVYIDGGHGFLLGSQGPQTPSWGQNVGMLCSASPQTYIPTYTRVKICRLLNFATLKPTVPRTNY